MQIDNINSSWVLAQQANDKGAKAVSDAESFAAQLKQATESMESKQHINADATGETQAKTAEQLAYDKKLRKACEGFEAMFMNIMYREMRNTVPENTLFGNSNADKILQDMLDTEMVNNMAAAGGVGLADVLYRQLTLEDKARNDLEERAMQHRLKKS
ncbi:MAG: rod-binding protein [Anaerovibrio sp.]|uniref:rod-binding protein n=1 Tax=Anaerovibrio sp. TaxID=1872532 RepID=UPI0025FBE16F|nr:rod-binding protein [Anaerovibrio sp.]MCR5176207.1 rod-binding protein [Anaerovibrio sp.]